MERGAKSKKGHWMMGGGDECGGVRDAGIGW